jgi:ABC-type oligopeptide transport system ATPase subunit
MSLAQARKPQQTQTLELLSRLDVVVKEGKVIGLYGPSLVGKSVLAAMVARDFVGSDGNVVIFGTENHYADDDYRALIEKFLPKNHYINFANTHEALYKFMYLVKRKAFEGRVALILDSLSFIAIRETARWSVQGVVEPRVIVARVVPVLYTVAAAFKDLVIEKHALGIMIMHASSMAGTGKFRGLVDLRPSMAGRVAHSLDYLLLLTSEGASLSAPRRLTLVMNRLNPLTEGREVKFKFVGSSVELVEESEKAEDKSQEGVRR